MDKQIDTFIDKGKISNTKQFHPHKYILLLSIAALYKSNCHRENKFYLDELIGIFNNILEKFFGKNTFPPNAIEYPFFILQIINFGF